MARKRKELAGRAPGPGQAGAGRGSAPVASPSQTAEWKGARVDLYILARGDIMPYKHGKMHAEHQDFKNNQNRVLFYNSFSFVP